MLEVTPEEEAEERVKAEEASRRETNGDGTNGGGTNGEATRRDDAKHALARGGFAALLTRGSDDRCERDVSRALRRGLKFLPHEKVDACTLGLLATHRQLVVAEKLAAEAAARATVRQHRRDHPRDKTTRAMDEDEDEDDVDASQREEDEEEEAARLAEDEDDEKVVRGWGNLKERLAASGAMLNVARLADDAAREIHRLGAAVFSRCPDEADEDDESIEADGGGNVESEEEDSKRAAAASRAFARLLPMHARDRVRDVRVVVVRRGCAGRGPVARAPVGAGIGGAGSDEEKSRLAVAGAKVGEEIARKRGRRHRGRGGRRARRRHRHVPARVAQQGRWGR